MEPARHFIEFVIAMRSQQIYAQDLRGEFNSTHEGYGVMKEEFDELWDKIKDNAPGDRLSKELVQIAAAAYQLHKDEGFFHVDWDREKLTNAYKFLDREILSEEDREECRRIIERFFNILEIDSTYMDESEYSGLSEGLVKHYEKLKRSEGEDLTYSHHDAVTMVNLGIQIAHFLVQQGVIEVEYVKAPNTLENQLWR